MQVSVIFKNEYYSNIFNFRITFKSPTLCSAIQTKKFWIYIYIYIYTEYYEATKI